MGKVGLEPTTTEVTDLQSAAIPITLYLPILINWTSTPDSDRYRNLGGVECYHYTSAG